MLLSIAGWSVLDDVTNRPSVTFVTLLFVLPVCTAVSIASIATREAGTGAAGSAVRVGFVSKFEGMARPASLQNAADFCASAAL
jgi:hypothetical protein